MEHGFTMVPNYLFACLLSLPAAQLKVLLFVVRRTLGWHKTEDRISLSQFEHGVGHDEGTGLRRGTIITAIQALTERGLIVVERERARAGDAAPSRFRLGPVFGTTVAGKSGHGVAGFSGHTKETVQNISKHHHDAAKPPGVEPRMDDDASCMDAETTTSREPVPAFSFSPSAAPQDVAAIAGLETAASRVLPPAPVVRRVTGTAVSQAIVSTPPSTGERPMEALELLDRLMANPLGYSPRSATQILAQFPPERIEAGLENLRFRKDVRNPAGWLLRELQAGGYAPPEARPGRRRAMLYALPETSAGGSVATAAPGGDEARLQEALASLSETIRAEWLLEARMTHALRAGKPVEKVPEDSFLVQAAFENLVLERWAA